LFIQKERGWNYIKMETQNTRIAEIERRLRVLSADRKNFGLTNVQEVEFIKLDRELKEIYEDKSKWD